MSISKEEYLKMLEELPDQYGDDDDLYSIPEEAWMPAEPPAKQRMKAAHATAVVDVLNFKKAKIKESLYQYMNIKIGLFLLRVEKYHGIYYRDEDCSELMLDISFWETKYMTPSGNTCNMDLHMNFHNDDRFTGKPWLSYFDMKGRAHNIPVETTVSIIRWLQAIQRLPAFL